ncbi:MAG: HAD-IC family P-type ATPase, partial [Acidimicrobiales bacterium]
MTAITEATDTGEHPHRREKDKKVSLFEPTIVRRALGDSIRKLDPRQMARNPVMFIVEVGSVWTTVLFFRGLSSAPGTDSAFAGLVAIWLWFTVLFANFAEAVAEGRGKAQADTLRKTRSETVAYVRKPDGSVAETPSTQLQVGDCCIVKPGQLIPGDGEVVEGIASVDESAITGESAPVLKEPGTDMFSSVTAGTLVISDRIVIRVTVDAGESFLDRMIRLVEGAKRQKTPNEIALTALLAILTLIFVIVVAAMAPVAVYLEARIN